jgi:hypothetical protein
LPLPQAQSVALLLVGCPWLLIQHIRSYLPCLEAVPSIRNPTTGSHTTYNTQRTNVSLISLSDYQSAYLSGNVDETHSESSWFDSPSRPPVFKRQCCSWPCVLPGEFQRARHNNYGKNFSPLLRQEIIPPKQRPEPSHFATDGRSVIRVKSKSLSESVCHGIDPKSERRSVGQSVSQSERQSVCQSDGLSVSQSVMESIPLCDTCPYSLNV